MELLKNHRFYIPLAAVIILFVGIVLGSALAANLEEIDLAVVNIGLIFANTIILLIIGSFVLDIKENLESKKSKK